MPYIGKQLSNGNYLKLDDISSSFNGSTTTFSLTNGGSAYYPGSEFSILVSVGGVIQEPESAYQINNDEITFANAPTAQDSFFCVVLGDAIGINVPGNNTVNGAQMAKPFNYDGGLLYLNDTDNRVGINSTSPGVDGLDIVGDLRVSGNFSTGIGGTNGGALQGNVYASSGISTFNDILVNGDLTVQGDTTTLNTTLRNVELLRVSAASTTPAGIVTQTGTGDILNLYDGSTEVFSVADGGITTLIKGIDITAGTSNLYQIDGSLSYYAANNAVYLNGAGATGWLRLQAAGSANDRTSINLIGHSKTNGDEISFRTNSTERLRIFSNGAVSTTGNVGIGTTIAGRALTIRNAEPRIRLIDDDTGSFSEVYTDNTGHLYLSADAGQSNGGSRILFNVDGGEKVRITSNGDLKFNQTQSKINLNTADGSDNKYLSINGGGDASQSRGAGITWYGNEFSSHEGRLQILAGNSGSANGVIQMHTGGAERARIASTGRVAIGNATNNASPTALFGVIADDGEADDLYVGKFHNLEATAGHSYGVDIRAGSNSTDHGFRVKNRANDAFHFLVRGDGAVGINSATPTTGYKLDVNGDLSLGEWKGTDNTYLDQKQDGDLHIINSGRTANGASNTPGCAGVGINRYNNISGGTSLFRDFCVYNGKNSKVLYVDGSTSNVGIGTDSPDLDLHVKDASGQCGVWVEGNDGGAGAYILLKNNSTASNPKTYVGGVDAGGQGTSQVEFHNLDNGTNEGALSLHTRPASGSMQERLRITSAGLVGIGEDTPTRNLHIDGTAHQSGIIIHTAGNHSTAIDMDSNRSSAAGGLAELNFKWNGTTVGQIGAYAGADTTNKDDGHIHFGTASAGSIVERLRITSGGNVNIGGNYTQTTYTMRVTGSFAATTKSFVIDHPTKENHKLRYACLEGPENSVYIRGRSSDSVIELPDYWVGLVHEDSITVNVTPIGNKNVWVESINNNSVTIGSDDSTEYFYTVFAERKDVEKLEVEVEN